MDKYFEFTRILSNIAFIAIVGLIFAGDYLYQRLDQSGNLKRLRLLCTAELFLILVFVLVNLTGLALLFAFKKFNVPYDIYRTILISTASAGFIVFYLKGCRYYLMNRDDRQIIGHWHMRKYFDFCKKQKVEKAFQHMQKASQFITDSVFVWCMLAYNEGDDADSSIADNYLYKAKEALKLSQRPITEEALIEDVTGNILFCRDQIEEGLTHCKKAYELDASFKKSYEQAVQWANEQAEAAEEEEEEEDGQQEAIKADTESKPAEVPLLLNSVCWFVIAHGAFLILFALVPLVMWVIFDYNIRPQSSYWTSRPLWQITLRHSMLAAYGALLVAAGAFCLKLKRIGWHLLGFATLSATLISVRFLTFMISIRGWRSEVTGILFFLLFFMASYVYLFTYEARTLLKVNRTKRWQMFLLQVGLCIACYQLFRLL